MSVPWRLVEWLTGILTMLVGVRMRYFPSLRGKIVSIAWHRPPSNSSLMALLVGVQIRNLGAKSTAESFEAHLVGADGRKLSGDIHGPVGRLRLDLLPFEHPEDWCAAHAVYTKEDSIQHGATMIERYARAEGVLDIWFEDFVGLCSAKLRVSFCDGRGHKYHTQWFAVTTPVGMPLGLSGIESEAPD